MIRILLAETQLIFRQGLGQIIASDHRMFVAGELQNSSDLLGFISNEAVDIIILDISISGKKGIETVREIKRLFPAMPVIILSIHPEDQYADHFFKAGASGFLTKETVTEQLLPAIEKVKQGGKYFAPQLGKSTSDSKYNPLAEQNLQALNSQNSGFQPAIPALNPI